MGYDQTGLRFGNKGAGACFVPVDGAATINLQDLKVTGYDTEEGSEEEVTAMTLDAAGRTLATYYWYDVTDGEDVFYGWYDDNGDLVDGVSVAPGEGLYVGAPSAEFSLQSAGQVPTSDIAVQLRFGNKHAVNPTPVALDIQGVWISGYDTEEGSEEEVTAMSLDAAGRTLATYYWYDVTDGEDVYYGWFDDNGDLVENVTIAPGTSFYFGAPSTSFYVNFPGVAL